MTWEAKKQKSIAILDKYRDRVSKSAYDRILYVIGTQAIEDMFMSEESIHNLIMIEKGQISSSELILNYKKKWGVA
jgi:hypothetical protein